MLVHGPWPRHPWKFMLAPIGAGSCSLAKAVLEFSWPREPWKFMLAPIGAVSCSLAKAVLEVHVSAYRHNAV